MKVRRFFLTNSVAGYVNKKPGLVEFAPSDKAPSDCITVELSQEEKDAIFRKAEKRWRNEDILMEIYRTTGRGKPYQ